MKKSVLIPIADNEYKEWILKIANSYKQRQIKAAVKVNEEMLRFYWDLGKNLEEKKMSYKWGSHFYESISKDLVVLLPNVKSFSPRNLLYMHQFYKMYKDSIITHQPGAQINEGGITHQDDAQLSIFSIPWGHHKLILDKCKDEVDKAMFFIRKTIENNWSRAMLMNFLDTNLYEREGKAISNFEITLPSPRSDLAQEMTKDPYNFDFLAIRDKYDEKDLKDALMANIQSFLLELGKGFAFVGREYRLVVGQTEQFLDMLFYNIPNHCYVVVEVKTRDFVPGDMGQLSTYIAATDGILRKEGDNQTVGLLICKSKDNVLAQYAVNTVNVPIGISVYDINNFLPEDYKGSMPTIEEIERKLK